MRELRFLTPRYDSFLGTIRSLRDNEIKAIWLIGENKLSDNISNAARQQGIALTRVATLNSTDFQKNQKNIINSKEEKAIVFTETSGELLSEQLLSCVSLDKVVVVAPITDWHFSRKALFLVAIPKSGTHLVRNLINTLGYKTGGEAQETLDPKNWYFLEHSNSHTVGRDFFVDSVRRMPFGNRKHPFMNTVTLFNYRHPLDILVSEANYYHIDGAVTFSGWLSQYSFSERIDRLMNDNWLLGSLRDRVGGFLPWLEFPNVIPLSYEELVGERGGGSEKDQHRLIWSLLLKLQVPGAPDEIASKLQREASPTFRSGKIANYIDCLSAEVIRNFATQNQDILRQFGYPLDGSFSLSTRRNNWLCKPLALSNVEFSSVPTIAESDFFGCNLIRYSGRVYALPRVAGDIDIRTLSPELFSMLPVAASSQELKRILLAGKTEDSRRLEALQQLGKMLRDKIPEATFDLYWDRSDQPHVFDSYYGFNIARLSDYYVAIRQSLGEIDLSLTPKDLMRLHGIDAVLFSTSESDLRRQIDELSSGQRVNVKDIEGLRQATTAANELTVKGIERLKQATTKANELTVKDIEGLRQATTASNDQILSSIDQILSSIDQILSSIKELNDCADQLVLDQKKIINRVVEHEQNLNSLRSNWLIEIAVKIAELSRKR